MKHQKGIIPVLLGIGILAVSLVLSSPKAALTQGPSFGKDVRVINSSSEAVPVQLQAGASVEITGTPTVAVVGTTPVIVGNPATSPVFVNVVQTPARTPWQAAVNLDLADGETSKFVSLPAPAPGKRVVIEFGSAQLLVLRTQIPYIQLWLSMTGSDASVRHTFALTNIGAYSEGQYVWQSSHPLRLTSAQGSVRVLRAGGSNGPFFATLTLAGYEEDNE